MKRVIEGRTYNTDTSTLIAKASEEWEFNRSTGEPEGSCDHRLYQTRGGAFFLVSHIETQRANSEGEWRDVSRYEFEPYTASEARHWTISGRGLTGPLQVEIITDAFGEPPEAEAEEAPGATLFVRVPSSLKQQVEGAAGDAQLSINAWVMRCMERCLSERC